MTTLMQQRQLDRAENEWLTPPELKEDEHHEIPKTTCVICGEPMDEKTEYVDACSFCLEDVDCMIDEPLKKYTDKEQKKALDTIMNKGIFEWFLLEYPDLSVDELTSLIFEGVERACSRRKSNHKSIYIKGA